MRKHYCSGIVAGLAVAILLSVPAFAASGSKGVRATMTPGTHNSTMTPGARNPAMTPGTHSSTMTRGARNPAMTPGVRKPTMTPGTRMR